MTNDILDNPVRNTLLSMAAPAAIGMLLTFLFQLVDTYFLGKLGGSALAAISFAYPVYILIVSVFMGVATGVAATVGRALGEGAPDKAAFLTIVSLAAFSLLAAGLGAVGYFNSEIVFSLLGASKTSLPLVSDYMRILYLGIFALVGMLIGNAALMAKGIMIKPTVIMGIAGLINLILDYVLIFGVGPIPALEMRGAALATVISWAVSLLLMLVVLSREGLLSGLGDHALRRASESLREIWTISLPAVAAQALNPVAIAVVTRLVSKFGDNAVAAYGIATRVESLALTGILSLSVIMTPVVAQNFGARKNDRIDQIVALSGRMTVYWGLMLFIVLALTAGPIASVFSDDADIVRRTAGYFYIVGISFAGFGLTLITTSFFNGVHQPRLSLKLTLIKTLCLTMPFAFAGGLISADAIWVGIAIANVAGAIVAGSLLKQWQIRNDSELVGHNLINDYLEDFRSLARAIRGVR